MSPSEREAFDAFLAELGTLGRLDPERAVIYLREATAGLRTWTRALREHPPRPRRRTDSTHRGEPE